VKNVYLTITHQREQNITFVPQHNTPSSISAQFKDKTCQQFIQMTTRSNDQLTDGKTKFITCNKEERILSTNVGSNWYYLQTH
jgi:hypothetical protein